MNFPIQRRPACAPLFACLCVLVFAAEKAAAQAQAKQGFELFHMVQARNIFDPERQPIRPATAPRPQTIVTRTDYASLTGTMVTADKALAFFSGSRAEFNKVLPVKGTIANATITRISAAEVEIERDGQKTVVPVGRQLPLTGSTLPAGPAPAPAAASASSGTVAAPAASPGDSSAPAAPSDKDDVIKRMMLRRAQQTSK